MNQRRNLYVRQNAIKNVYLFNTIKTTVENENIIGRILYDFVYTSLNLIIFYRGLYSKDSFSIRQCFGFQIPCIQNPDVVNYIRTITEKIVNFHLSDVLEGFAYEECNRRTRERLAFKFHYYGTINLTPSTFEEFQTNVEDLKISCKSLIFDLRRSLRTMESSSSLLPKSGKVEKQRRRPRWKIVFGLKVLDGVESTLDVNNIGIFKNDPDWEVFPWKKSKVGTLGGASNRIENGSPLNEMDRIISESDSSSGDPVFYYDCRDLLNEDYYEEQTEIFRDDDIKPLYNDDREEEEEDLQQQQKDSGLRKAVVVPLSNDDGTWYDAMDVSQAEVLKKSPSSASAKKCKNTLHDRRNGNSSNEGLIEVVTIDDDGDEISNSPAVKTQSDPSAASEMELNCGSPDMFEDPLEIFEDLEETTAQQTTATATNVGVIKTNDHKDISVIVQKEVNTTPNSNVSTTTEKRASLKMFSISSVHMIDTLMCNILLLKYPPRIPIRKPENEIINSFSKSLKQMVSKKRRALVFD